MDRRTRGDRRAAPGRLGHADRRQRHTHRRLGRRRQASSASNFAGQASSRDMQERDEGTTTAAGFDGIRRIFAYRPRAVDAARLAVGLDESVVHSGIDREISVAYLQLALFGMLVLMLAMVRRRAAHGAADPVAGAHRGALRPRRPARARHARALGRRIRAAGRRARRYGGQARRPRGGIADRQSASRRAGEPRRPDGSRQPARLRPPARARVAARRRNTASRSR